MNVFRITATCPSCAAEFKGETSFEWEIRRVSGAYRSFHRLHRRHGDYTAAAPEGDRHE